MDVRCDRCETEYELDDAIVTEAGASVQCTTCGHTFTVTRGAAAAAGKAPARPSPAESGPEVPEWTLTTDDGKVHRLRDLNTLQKWIVERKVTRTERISRAGGPPLTLGDVIELAPFFAVVDEADRARVARHTSTPARGAEPGGRASSPSAPSRPTPTGTAPREPQRPVSEDGPTVPNRRLPGILDEAGLPLPGIRGESRAGGEGLPGVTPSPRPTTPRGSSPQLRAAAPLAPAARATITEEARVLEPAGGSNLARNITIGLGVAAAVVVAIVLWLRNGSPAAPPAAPVSPRASASISPPNAGTTTSGPSVVPLPPHGPAAGAARTAAASAAHGSGEAVPVAASSGGATAASASAEPKAGAASAAHGSAEGSPARGYEQLVTEADRLLERGKSVKADKLYAQALAIRPDGVAAITGSAYVLLDRQRHFKAIETFRRALAIEPAFGPALFGIGESYRARGDYPQALTAYRQYLAISPSGTDAPAARRQIKDLEAAAAGGAAESAGSTPPSGENP